MFQIPDTLFSTMIARRFFALPLILCAFPIFEGILSQRIFVRPFCSPAILCGLVLIHATLNSAPSSRHDDTFFEKHVRNVFSVIEPNAVLLTGNDADFMVAQYGKYVLGFTNVDDIAFGIQSINWYRKMMKPRFDIPDTLFSGPIIELIQALIKKKPVYLLSYPHDEPKTKSLLKKSFPVGPCIKIIDDNDTLPYPREIFIMNMKLFQNNLELPSRADVTYYSPWNYSSLGYYYRTWNSIGSALKKMGDETLSQRAFTYRDAFDINDGN